MKKWFGLVVVFLVLGSVQSMTSLAQEIVWNVSTDHEVYSIGQTVRLSLEACNAGSVIETVDINAAPSVIDNEGNQVFAPTLLPWVNYVDIPPGECQSALDQFWDQLDSSSPPPLEQVPPGWYRGEYLSGEGLYFFSPPFEIQAPRAVPVSTTASIILIVVLAVLGWIILGATRRA